MDERVLRAIDKWPNVPDVYGWLALDVRGRWWLDGSLIRNSNTTAAIGRNYESNEKGQWYYQNGPQRAFVDLSYTPWVYRLDGAGQLTTHTQKRVESVHDVWLDDEHNLLLLTEHGIGLVSDQDLEPLLDKIVDSDRVALDWDELEKRLYSDNWQSLYLDWQDLHPIQTIERRSVARRFEFVAQPRSIDRLGN